MPAKRLGSTEPRIWTPPLRELTPETSLGFECISFAEDTLGLSLMPWQKWFLTHALELHPTEVDDYGDPVFRFRKVVLLVGRQNGKSTVMQALTLWRLFVDRASLVLGTAQDLEVAESLWSESLDMALDIDELREEIERGGKVERQPGRKMFRLRSRETYKVKAASRRGGRGLSGELVLLDELREHQSWDAWAAVTKTTNAKPRAQVYGISNAGDATSVVLRYLRQKAHDELGDPDRLNADISPDDLIADEVDEDADIDSGLGLFEWSAPPGSDVMDRDAWAMSNPSLGYRIRESVLASDAKTDPEWVFRTECLCQWSDGTLEGPFPPGSWDAGRWDKDAEPPQIVGNVVACVDMSQDRIKTYIAFAGRTADGRAQVEVVAERAGSDWVADWLRERAGIIDAITGQTRGAPVSSLMEDLDAELGKVINFEDWGGADLAQGTGKFYDLVRENALNHNPWPSLDLAAATAVPKLTEAGAFLWDRKRSPTDVAPLQAATGAIWLLHRPTEEPATSAYEARGVLTI
jgi:hypothetical protein